MRSIVSVIMILGTFALGAGRAAEPLQVRWGGEQSTVMQVLGIDGEGRVRLRPMDGAQGEALVPLAEAENLQFLLPESYREAQQRVFVGRPAEAVFLLRAMMPAYVPYAHIEGSNVGAAVGFYFNLLIDQREWAEALGVASGLVEQPVSPRIMPDLVRLVRALQAADRVDDAAWLVGRLPINDSSASATALITGVADQMRRDGHWAEAHVIYQRLREQADAPEETSRWDRLLAYTDWHQGSPLRAGVLVAASEEKLVPTQQDGLMGLLMGRVALADEQPQRALDVLSETLIGIDAASEWRVEITAVIAAAYRAQGAVALARLIEADLRRMHPASPWIATEFSDA